MLFFGHLGSFWAFQHAFLMLKPLSKWMTDCNMQIAISAIFTLHNFGENQFATFSKSNPDYTGLVVLSAT
jgi:hypothetical protein